MIFDTGWVRVPLHQDVTIFDGDTGVGKLTLLSNGDNVVRTFLETNKNTLYPSVYSLLSETGLFLQFSNI